MPIPPPGRLASALGPAAFALATAAGTIWLATNNGSYDVVPRQTAGILVWWAIALAVLVVRRPLSNTHVTGTIVVVSAIGIAVWTAVGFSHTSSTERTAVEFARAIMHLGVLVLVGMILPPRSWRAVVAGLTVAMVSVCGLALADRLSPGLIGGGPIVVFDTTASRISAPLGYWNALGSWTVLTALLLIGRSAHSTNRVSRALSLAFVPMVAVVGYLTYSRAAIAALVVGVALLLLLSPNRWTVFFHLTGSAIAGGVAVLYVRSATQIANGTGTHGAAGVITAIVICGLAVAAVALVTGRLRADQLRLPSSIGRRVIAGSMVACVVVAGGVGAVKGPGAWRQFKDLGTEQASDPSARLTTLHSSRYPQWKAAVDAWEKQPWRGTGPGTFELTYNVAPDAVGFVRDAHNAFLETLSEQGIPGLALLLTLIGSGAAAFVVALRKLRDPAERGLVASAAAACAAFVLGTGIDWLWEVTALAGVALVLLGVAVAAVRAVPQADESTIEEPQRSWFVGRAVVVGVAIIAMGIELPGLVGTSEVRRSQTAVSDGDLVDARARADRAIDVMPWASSPYVQRGLVDERAGAFSSARRSLELAQARDPKDWRMPLLLARVDAEAGDPTAALRAFRTAKRLRPNGDFFR